ncbi:MAG TPA: hypothetical protein VMT42_02405 [candidate division Zixibacteria bacterium]|nr:hypothetical protein [candidate division Zixibacteria bacterium]
MIRHELDKRISEFEQILQKIASAIASGVLSEKLPPSKLLEKTNKYIACLSEAAASTQESMLILKPEKTLAIKVEYRNLTQTLTTFKDILLQNTSDPVANSRLAFEQLKKAMTDGSDYLFLMREVRENPSPFISHLLDFKEASAKKSSIMSIRTAEHVQPLTEYVLKHIEELNAGLTEVEKRIAEIRQGARELQEESLKALSRTTEEQTNPTENKTEKRQLSLSNFKAERN